MKMLWIAKVNRDKNATSSSPRLRPLAAKYLSPRATLADLKDPSFNAQNENPAISLAAARSDNLPTVPS